ncbi:MAG: hypothetical protein P1P89_20915 [Desulfobacterales bacterium]|nr:hypothetical protein [Desulfobacterales bacterium]
MVLNAGALAIGAMKSLKTHSITPSFRFYLTVSSIFIVLFGISIVGVTQLRNYQYSDSDSIDPKINFSGTGHNVMTLIIDRWIGIEGTIAVSSYPKLGWKLWKQAWKEKYSNQGTSFYDLEIASSGYAQMDFSKHHFISLPGILAFCYYPGSLVFLFITMFLAASFAAAIEISIYNLSQSNLILAALFAQVVASRFTHFGYAPGRSYLLFGVIFINISIIYILNKYFTLWYRNEI